MGRIRMKSGRFNQKNWYYNMNKIITEFQHKGAENHLFLVHMLNPKEHIDRKCGDSKVWRWKY